MTKAAALCSLVLGFGFALPFGPLLGLTRIALVIARVCCTDR